MVLLGIACRVARWAADNSLWGDDAALAMNLLNRSWLGLLSPLAYHQSAPPGFLLLQKGVVTLLGPGESALRLVPLLAGVAGLVVFARLALLALEPAAALAAVAFAAFSEPLVFYSAQVKQYSLEVLVSLLILHQAARLLSRSRPPSLRTFFLSASLGLWFSFSAPFATGAAVACFLLRGLRSRDRRFLRELAGGTLLFLGVLVLIWLLFLRHLGSDPFMHNSWSDSYAPFPPENLLQLAWYPLRMTHFFNDPAGFAFPAAAGILFLAGLVPAFRRDPWTAALLFLPFPLLLAASMAEAYPFATSPLFSIHDRFYPFYGRLILFLVPLAYLFAGAGAARPLSFGGWKRLPGLLAAGAVAGGMIWQAGINVADPPPIHELRPLMPILEERRAPRDVFFVQYYGAAVLHYYLTVRKWPDVKEKVLVVRLAMREDVNALMARMEEFVPGDRLWLITLYHPGWQSEEERAKLRSILDLYVDEQATYTAVNAEATLFRVRER